MAGQVIGIAARSELGRRGNQSGRGVHRDGCGGAPMPAAGPPSTRTAASTPAAAMLASSRALVCGILNATPDSFYDGGRYMDQAAAVEHGRRIVTEGADLIDVGGESTRPDALSPTIEDELARVVTVIESLSRSVAVPLSVDTSRPVVMREAARAGATMNNDVRALRLPGSLAAAAELDVPVRLMHMQGEPDRMQDNPVYNDVVADVRRFLADRLRACERAGVDRGQLVVDPASGSARPSITICGSSGSCTNWRDSASASWSGCPRKGMIGAVTGRSVEGRSIGSAAAAMIAAQRGASVFRVHDVAATRDVLAALAAVEHHEEPPP